MATTTRHHPTDIHHHRTLAQSAALVFGLSFLVVGIAGFIPGITTHLGDITFAGHDSPAKLIGVFQVSVLHNLAHLLLGVLGVAAARSYPSARAFLIGAGVVYALLWLYGLFVDNGSSANFVPLNTADDWLHFILAAAMIVTGLAATDPADRGAPATSPMRDR